MKGKFNIIIFIIIIIILCINIIPENLFYGVNWILISVLIISVALLAFFIKFERQNINSKEIALIATMASIAGISRVPFAAIMSVQPTTFIVMITGYVFGSQTGFIVGAVAALVSNFFLGQGPWTPWQMFCWGICGVIAAQISKTSDKFNLRLFTLVCGLCGYLFGWTMNIWHWIGFVYPLNVKTFLATYITSFPFDTIHSIGNIVFSMVFGKSFFQILVRFKKKIQTIYF